MGRALIGFLLLAMAFVVGFIALRASRHRKRVAMAALTVLLALSAAGVLWWPVGGTSAPLPNSVRLYISTYDSLVALRASTGEQEWTFHTGSFVSEPAIADGVVYVVVADNTPKSATLYALKAENGAKLWQVRLLAGAAVASTPAVGDGVVYVSATNGVYALNASDGTQRWRANISTSSTNASSPTLADGMLYLAAGGGDSDSSFTCVCVYALRANDGAVMWTHPTNAQVFARPMVADGVVYAGTPQDGLFALRASDGTLLWTQPSMGISSSPTVVNGVIYINGDNYTYALSARDGSQIWHTTQAATSVGAVTVSGGVAYVGVASAITALRADDGTLLWRSQQGDNTLIFSTPRLIQGVVFASAFCTGGDFGLFNACHDQVVALDANGGSRYWSHAISDGEFPVVSDS